MHTAKRSNGEAAAPSLEKVLIDQPTSPYGACPGETTACSNHPNNYQMKEQNVLNNIFNAPKQKLTYMYVMRSSFPLSSTEHIWRLSDLYTKFRVLQIAPK